MLLHRRCKCTQRKRYKGVAPLYLCTSTFFAPTVVHRRCKSKCTVHCCASSMQKSIRCTLCISINSINFVNDFVLCALCIFVHRTLDAKRTNDFVLCMVYMQNRCKKEKMSIFACFCFCIFDATVATKHHALHLQCTALYFYQKALILQALRIMPTLFCTCTLSCASSLPSAQCTYGAKGHAKDTRCIT